MKKITLLAALTVSLSCGTASAGVVKVWGEELSGFNLSTINSFYNGLSGHSSSIATGSLDTVNLTGVNLLWATQPADDYSAAELNSMSNFLTQGGRIAFLGEHGTFAPAQNQRINSALSFLGSSISIDNLLLDSYFRSASIADGQILAHDLTAGVSTYEYAAFAPLTISGSAQALMYGEDSYNGGNSIMMAYQNIGPGSIFLITDQNVWDNAPLWSDFDNERMFENLLSGKTGAPPVSVPEPTPILLFGLSLLALVARRFFQKVQ